MTRSFFAIVNGAAGGGRCRSRADGALAALEQAGIKLDVHFTEGPRHAIELASDAYQDGHRAFLSVGGDGTSFEIVNGVFQHGTPERVQIAMLPLGTGNSFLRDFGITSEDKAREAIVRGTPHAIDAIALRHGGGTLHFINTMGIGFVARVGALTNEKFKALGTGGYVAAVVTSVAQLQYPLDPLIIDDATEPDSRPAVFLSFSNSQYTGGAMHLAPNARLDDGKFDIIRVGKLGRAGLLATFPKIFAGTHVEHPLVEQTQATKVKFSDFREQDVLMDGEFRRLSLRSLQLIPQALEVIA